MALSGLAQVLHAADPRPTVGPGATKDDVIDAYGWPNGQSQSGTKEILTYPQGLVTLENGRVEKVDFLTNVPWPAPRPRPGAASPTSVKPPELPVDFWVTRFDEAAREATRRRARILALFTGSDWSPASKQFHEEVEFHADFVNAFTGDYVFLRLDFASRTPVPAELREQNAQLRARYEVTVYPTLLVLSPAGTLLARIDLTKQQAGDSYRSRVIAAVREKRDSLAARPPPPDPGPAAAGPPPTGARVEGTTEAGQAAKSVASPGVTASLRSARRLIMGAVGIGVLIAAYFFWLLWRKRAPRPATATTSMADRISNAAGGLPTPAEIAAWPREKVRAIVAGLAETDGYVVDNRSESDADLALKRPGETRARVLIVCAAGTSGVVPAKRVRELFGTMTAEGVEVGWWVAPAGFSADARAFADEHGLLLLDAERLLAQLGSLPPLLLPKVLLRR
ncbi:MAG: restriction endonuclease [Verrucomicrobia bacterium]|nr:restriction endonuclease [Verrucomicrobiota bacterium]